MREAAAPRRRLSSLRLCAALLVGLAQGGCSVSMPFGSLMAEPDLPTGSIQARPASPLHPDLGAEDWRRARAALGVALDPQGAGAGVNWDNPDSGARGSFTPVGQPFVREDEVCRAFLAVVHGAGEASSLQGTACRPTGGEWSIREVRPFRRPG